ncbi:MAG: response regulator transcription factor [Beijerinckiaceae bacterium]|nr:response regulator transcription factor [Beijerinckiaceae bacterium]MCI0599354.1 response regulator transcription factor [Beijerinckiaceae bacterium]MCI0734825.1 response regulator transcription factor [Beijerinckiaceae bacterium]
MKILIVDDHPIVRAGLRRLIAIEPATEIGEAANATDALASYAQNRPDLVIMDLNLPGTGGLEAIRRLVIEDKSARILVFSVHGDSIHAARAFEAGALGYVTKNAPPGEISLAIVRVAKGENYIEPEIAQELALQSVRSSRGSSLPHPFKDLTRRDLEILRLLGEGKSLMQIAESVSLSYKTVANNCSIMKNKLGLARSADLIRIAVEHQDFIRSGTD